MTATADITDESTPAAVAVGRAAIDAAQESLDGMENLSDDATAALQGRIDDLEAGYSPIEMTAETNAANGSGRDQEDGHRTRRLGRRPTPTPVSVAVPRLPSQKTQQAPIHSSIERDRMATKVTITVNGAAADDSDDVEFMQAMDLGDGRTMHTRTMDADADGNVVRKS